MFVKKENDNPKKPTHRRYVRKIWKSRKKEKKIRRDIGKKKGIEKKKENISQERKQRSVSWITRRCI